MRLLLFGSGEFARPTFESLRQHHDIVAVISQPDRPAGRKRTLTATPVAAWAQAQNLPLHKIDNINTPPFIETVREGKPDASVVIAFGQKLSPDLLIAMGRLSINLHASLLPKYRGAAPINWAMIHGEHTTGISVIALAQQMDAGDIYAQTSLQIDPDETAGELHDRLAQLGPAAVQSVLDDLQHNTLKPQPQDPTHATSAPKLKKTDGTVDFNQPADRVRAHVHGLTPWPGCCVHWHCPQTDKTQTLILRRVKDHPDAGRRPRVEPGTVSDHAHIACARGTLQLIDVQPPGKPTMSLADFTRGHDFAEGLKLEGVPNPGQGRG